MALYDTSGVLFNMAPVPVCLQTDVQENPFVVQTTTETTVFWADNRSSVGNGRQVFMQRYDANGAPLLAADGVLAMQCNGNLNGFPRAIAAENNSHIVALYTSADLLGGIPGFRVGRVTNTGTNLWSDTTRFCTPALGPNGGTDFSMTSDGDGGVMAAWFNWQNNAIYAARLDRWGRMGDFTAVEERDALELSLHPNPTRDRITVQAHRAGALESLRILAADGRLVHREAAGGQPLRTIDVSGLPEGMYTLLVEQDGRIGSIRFVKQ
jgi:hypothetical protein